MTLYLTSNGFEDNYVAERFKKVVLKKDPDKASFLVISVQDNESDAFYLQKTKDELSKIGVTNIDIFELREEKFNIIKEYDVIYVCGGNTFVYLDRMRKTGLDKYIINSVGSNRSIYVGVSAGSIIAGPNIEIAGWGKDSDPNYMGLTDLSGLNLTNMVVYPHYREELKSDLDKFRERYGYQVIELEDNQAVRLSYSDIGSLKNVISMEYINKDE